MSSTVKWIIGIVVVVVVVVVWFSYSKMNSTTTTTNDVLDVQNEETTVDGSMDTTGATDTSNEVTE